MAAMDEPPEFLSFPTFTNRQERYVPAPPNRRGEALAWLCALGIGIAGLVLTGRYGAAPCLTWQLLGIFILAGGAISLGNWLDSRTHVELSPQGIAYQSPLRRLNVRWEEVQAISAIPLRRGWRLLVESSGGRFALRTICRLSLGPVESQPIGFPEGERIASLIRGMAGLPAPVQLGDCWVSRRKA